MKKDQEIALFPIPAVPLLLTYASPVQAHGQQGLLLVGACFVSLFIFLITLLFLWGGYKRAAIALVAYAGLTVLIPQASAEWLGVSACVFLASLLILVFLWGGWKKALVVVGAYLVGTTLATLLSFALDPSTTALVRVTGISADGLNVIAGVVLSAGGWIAAGAAFGAMRAVRSEDKRDQAWNIFPNRDAGK